MATFACLLGLAAGLACDPDQSTSPLHRVGARANLANPDSVAMVNLCGPRLNIQNANDDSIAVTFYPSTSIGATPQTLMLPRRPAGEPYSETFVLMTSPYGASLQVGTRLIIKPQGTACPSRPVVPAVAPPAPAQAVVDAGLAFLLPDTSYRGWHISFKRFSVEFFAGTPQPVRQAILDAVNATVLGGDELGMGRYYIEVPLPLDSGVGPRNAVWHRLLRNSAVKRAAPELGGDVITPGSVTPNDGSSWSSWAVNGVDVSHFGWHLEMDRAPLAWGCSTGGAVATVAFVDAGFEPNSDVPVSTPGPVGPTLFLTHHASRVSSVLRATGNNGKGMAGMTWNGNLTYFWKDDYQTPVTTISGSLMSQRGALYGIMRAIASGARVVNVSLGQDWYRNGNGRWPLTHADSVVLDTEWSELAWGVDLAFDRSDSTQWPLVVFSAGNNAVDAGFNLFPQIMRDPTFRHRNQVVVVGGLAKNVTPTLWVGTGMIGTTLLDGSNRGDLIDVLAPAQLIHTLNGGDVDSVGTGVSYAAPQVAGVAALALAMNPALRAADLKQLILTGSAAGNRFVNVGIGAPRQAPVLDAYETLRAVARTPGTPLCGNRVWADSNQIFVKRDTVQTSTTGETIVTASKPIRNVTTYHGGRKLKAWYTDGTSEMFLLTGSTWASGAAPVDSLQTSVSGAAFSQFGYSHGGDTLMTVSITPVDSTAAVVFSAFLPPDLLTPVFSNTKSIAYLSDTAKTCTYMAEDVPFGLVAQGKQSSLVVVGPVRRRNGQIGDASVHCHGYTLNVMQPIARPLVAYSPTGTFVYVAINRQVTRFGPDTGWVGPWCDPSLAALFVNSWCRGGAMQQVTAGVTIARLNVTTTVLDTIWSDAVANAHTLAVSENGTELAYTFSRDTVSWSMPTAIQAESAPWGRYDFVGYASTARVGACSQVFRVLATGVLAVRQVASGCEAQPRTLATFNSVIASGKISALRHQAAHR